MPTGGSAPSLTWCVRAILNRSLARFASVRAGMPPLRSTWPLPKPTRSPFFRSSRIDARAAMVDNRTLGEVDRDTRLRASPPELLVSAGLEIFSEATYGGKDGPPHEQIRCRGKALLHVVTLAKEPAGVNESRRATERPRVSSGFGLPLAVRRSARSGHARANPDEGDNPRL